MIQIRKSHERGHANHGWLDSRHTFSFANYYDPNFMGFSSLRVINEDIVAPGMGFATHPHKNMEILSYVLQGSIAHQDSMGNVKTFQAGEFQMMSAGTGVQHSEFNPSEQEILHFLQIWIQPNELNIPPRYEQKQFSSQEGATLILSPNAENGSIKVYQDMKLWRNQYSTSQQITLNLEKNRKYWLHMVRGSIKTAEYELSAGDALAISQENQLIFESRADTEFLLFDLPE